MVLFCELPLIQRCQCYFSLVWLYIFAVAIGVTLFVESSILVCLCGAHRYEGVGDRLSLFISVLLFRIRYRQKGQDFFLRLLSQLTSKYDVRSGRYECPPHSTADVKNKGAREI